MSATEPIPITATLSQFAGTLRYADLPPECVARAKSLILDFVGSIVRAAHEADSTACLTAALATLGLDGEGASTVPALGWRRAPPVAALANGMLGHSLDFDDTHAGASLHPSATVVPAALAVGEQTGASGAEIVAAVIAGYEISCRLGLALGPSAHYARGFHPTATAGTFGAAVAAARLYGQGADGIARALGVAGSQAAGSIQFLANGAWNKRWQVGQAAMNGVIAGALASNGFVAAAAAIEGERGFLRGYSDTPDFARAVAGLGSVWETMRIGMKPYPSCRYTHAALDALARIRADNALTAADFTAVRIGLHDIGARVTGDPIEKKRRARTLVDAQFSMPFTAAVMMDQGRFGWEDYRRIADPAAERLADLVEIWRDESLESLDHPFGGTVEVESRRGRFALRVETPSGEPETFPDEHGMQAKFMGLAQPVIGADAVRIRDAILAMETADRFSAMPR